MTWTVRLDIELVSQFKSDYCGPACAQMVLSTMGLCGLNPQVQILFKTSINFYKGPWLFGSPVGVACTINRYNSGFPGAVPGPPSKEYRVARTPTPYEAVATVVNALHRHAAASVVMVYGSTHWVVVFGAEGQGDPDGGSYSIDNLWVCNPGDAKFGSDTIGVRQRIPYAQFLSEYFDGCNDERTPNAVTMREFGDGCEFVIVTDSRAVPHGKLQLPVPEVPQFPVPPAIDIAQKVLAVQGHSDGTPLTPYLVQRIDRPDEHYYLVPFVRDHTADIVRLDMHGTYLGTALDVGDLSALPGHDGRALEAGVAHNNAAPAKTLVWAPSRESPSPYSPFFKSADAEFVPVAGGLGFKKLHDRATGDAIAPPPDQATPSINGSPQNAAAAAPPQIPPVVTPPVTPTLTG